MMMIKWLEMIVMITDLFVLMAPVVTGGTLNTEKISNTLMP